MIDVGSGFNKEIKFKLQQIYVLLDTTYRPITEGYMKANKPWTTRTGMAVAGLHSRVEGRGSMIKLVLGHGVSYGVYLELGHKVKSKKGKVREVKPYAILKPTMEKYYPEISKNVQRIWQS